MNNFKEIFTPEEWTNVKENKTDELIIFKYSPICSISSSVEEDFDNWLSQLPKDKNISCVKVNVIDSRPLSRQIADELNVFHQSPQVIWLTNDKKVKWSASHYDISINSLSKNI